MDIWSRIISSPPILAYFIVLAISLGFGLGLFFVTHRFTDIRMRRSHNDISRLYLYHHWRDLRTPAGVYHGRGLAEL